MWAEGIDVLDAGTLERGARNAEVREPEIAPAGRDDKTGLRQGERQRGIRLNRHASVRQMSRGANASSAITSAAGQHHNE